MEFAIGRCAQCTQTFQRQTTSLAAQRFWTGSRTLWQSSNHYSTKLNSEMSKSRSHPEATTPTPQLSALKRPHYLTEKPKLYNPLLYPKIQNSRFEFAEERFRREADVAPVPREAETISEEYAGGISTMLMNNRARDPVALFGILAGWLLRHQARNMGYEVAPDGFVRVSDILRFPPFSRYSVDDLGKLVEKDAKDRFEMVRLPDFVEGEFMEVWWIRARMWHSIPGVSPHSKRILNLYKTPFAEYRTRPENWDYIQTYGIPEGEDHLIRLNHPLAKDLFEETIPETDKILSVIIDCHKAAKRGVMFFHTNDVKMYAVGTQEKRVIPVGALKSAVIIDISKESMT